MTEVRHVREPNRDDIDRAAEVVARYLRPTPLIESSVLGETVLLKLDSLQPTGSFKVRGGLAALASARDDDPSVEVVTASAGNHGLGIAYAAKLLGVRATVVIPVNASEAKRTRLESFEEHGVKLVLNGGSYDEAESHALDLAHRGARYISAYNDTDVIAGQATVALEIFDQATDVEVIVAPVGGGGLLAGVAFCASDHPGVKVIGAEAAASPAVSTSVAHGHVVEIPENPTVADGLAGNIEPGSVTVSMVARLVHKIVGVTEDEILDSMRSLVFKEGVVAEASGAVAYAAVALGLAAASSGRVVPLISGRNVAADRLASYLKKAEP